MQATLPRHNSVAELDRWIRDFEQQWQDAD
jgi:hypothetical protein